MSVNFVFKPDLFLVCGWGSLGQHLIATLKQFGVLVHAINDFYPQHWETDVLPDLFVEGDFRYQQVLEKAKIRPWRFCW